MKQHQPVIALAQRLSGWLLVGLGGLLAALWLLGCAYFVYDLFSYISSMVPGARPVHYTYPLMGFAQQLVVVSAGLLLPGLVLAALGALKLTAARALALDRPSARWLGLGAGVVDVLMCGPSSLLGVATLVVVLSSSSEELV